MYYDFNDTVSFQEVKDKYKDKYFWRCDAGHTSLPDDGDILLDVYDVLIYDTKNACDPDEDGKYALDRLKVRADNYSRYFECNTSGTIQ